MENSIAATQEARRFIFILASSLLPQLTIYKDAALSFSRRLNSPLAHASFEKWHKVYLSHKNSQTVAAFRHSDCLRRKTLLAWRIKLRNKHKLMSKARTVDKFLVVRSAWLILRAKFAERRRENMLKALELRKSRNIFYGTVYFRSNAISDLSIAWFERAHRRRVQRLAEEQIRARIIKVSAEAGFFVPLLTLLHSESWSPP
jgi:hypothetical protein